MFTHRTAIGLGTAIAAIGILSQAYAQPSHDNFTFGKPLPPGTVAGWDLDVVPNGAGLPEGQGTPEQGAAIFAANCAACHGADAQGTKVPGKGMFPRLVGGLGTLATDQPVKTVGSFWPYPPVSD